MTGKNLIIAHLGDLNLSVESSINNISSVIEMIEDSLINDSTFDSLAEAKIYGDTMISFYNSTVTLNNSLLSLKRIIQSSRITNQV